MVCTCNSHNMDMRDMPQPDMHALSPWAGMWPSKGSVCISGKSQMYMLQVLCNTLLP